MTSSCQNSTDSNHTSLPAGKLHLNTLELVDVSNLTSKLRQLKNRQTKNKDRFRIKQIKNNTNMGEW